MKKLVFILQKEKNKDKKKAHGQFSLTISSNILEYS